MKVLMSAYACEPGKGSEEGIGWNWARQVALRNECFLLTRRNNVEAVRATAKAEGLTTLHVIPYDLPYWMRFWKRKGRGAVAYFYLWQLGAGSLARRLDREYDFDVLHHTTFASSWIPSGLSLVGKPFVWGPVGQHPRIPRQFLRHASRRLRWGETAKALLKKFLLRCDPLLRLTMRRARVILSLGSEFETQDLPRGSAPLIRMPACGVDRVDTPVRKEGLSILFAGRLVELKGPRLALCAFAECYRDHPEMSMSFLGEGPLREALQQRAADQGLQGAVHFLGELPHERVFEYFREAEIFLFPSFEGAGMVVPEAMASGAVVLCLDFGGPGDMVAGGRGMSVPVCPTEEETVSELARALRRLVENAELRQGIRERALTWVREEMLWSRKGERLQGIYRKVLASGESES